MEEWCKKIVFEKVPHFFLMSSKEKKEVEKWLEIQENDIDNKTDREKEFLGVVKEGLETIKSDYWISTIEPTMNKKTQKIEFIEGAEVAVGYNWDRWEKFAKEFMPERGSRIAELRELFLWYAWRIVKGYWTLDHVANDSTSAGDYIFNPVYRGKFEKSAAREVGKFRDGIGNTCKIVRDRWLYALVVGNSCVIEHKYLVGALYYYYIPKLVENQGSAVFVLTK